LVGQRGTRISAVINELGGEKIDAVEYSEEPEEYIANALSPASVLEVKILEKNKALAIVPGDQLSLAIGKDGQNVRLAAKLTGWKIDVRGPGEEEPEEEVEEEKVEEESKEEKDQENEEEKTDEGIEEKEDKETEEKKDSGKKKKQKSK